MDGIKWFLSLFMRAPYHRLSWESNFEEGRNMASFGCFLPTFLLLSKSLIASAAVRLMELSFPGQKLLRDSQRDKRSELVYDPVDEENGIALIALATFVPCDQAGTAAGQICAVQLNHQVLEIQKLRTPRRASLQRLPLGRLLNLSDEAYRPFHRKQVPVTSLRF